MIKFTDLLFPPQCICCGELLERKCFDSPLCAVCLGKWELAKNRCRNENHGRPVREIEPFGEGGTHEFVPYSVEYTPGKRMTPENELIFGLKDSPEKKIIDFVAREFAAIVTEDIPIIAIGGSRHADAIITWIPRRRASVRKFGFDHMERTAKALSGKLSIPAVPLIKRLHSSYEQKQLNSRERRLNAERTMTVERGVSLDGKLILIIDDIVTTGASLLAASKLLLDAGAEQVMPMALAATERPLDPGKRRIEDNFNIIKK